MEDEPLGYQPSRGLRVSFHLSYRQRGAVIEDPSIFGVGTNWATSFRAYLVNLMGPLGIIRVHRGSAGWIDYTNGLKQFRDGSIVSTPDNGATFEITYPDGRKDVFGKQFITSLGYTNYFMTAQKDSAARTITFSYVNNPVFVQLSSVVDPDGKTTHLYYEDATFTNQITKVVDPFNRTNLLKYDEAGYLTNIVDVAGLSTGFMYDGFYSRRGWITNMATPYGPTGFRYLGLYEDYDDYNVGNDWISRAIEVTLPTGGKHLFAYRQDCSAIMPYEYTPAPDTSPLPNTIDNYDQWNRNSFHWTPLQYAALSANYLSSNGDVTQLTADDFKIARLRHWLVLAANTPTVLSVERWPSPDGSAMGQVIWYDYEGKPNVFVSGNTALPNLIALVLPDGSTRFSQFIRNSRGIATNDFSTYTKLEDGSVGLRSNRLVYAANDIDMVLHVGPQGEQVVSNYFGNAYHQPDASYDALNQETRYTYNGNRQLTTVVRPSGLTTINTYFASGDYVDWPQKTVDVEIQRTNSYTYSNGLVDSHTDERSLTVTNYWDNLQRLIGRRYPDATTISNRYTALDLTATKDRLGYWSYSGYNGIRQKVAETNANGVVTRYGYCDCGALKSVTNAWNTAVQFVTQYDYDLQGNRIYTYLPDATLTNWFDSLRRVDVQGDAWGYRYFDYNNQGLRTNIDNAYGSEHGIIYDIEDRAITVKDANGVIVTNSYDLLGRLRIRGYQDGGMERFGYTGRGLVAYTNQLDKITRYFYDEGLRKIAETNANNEVILYTNNAAGDLLSLTDGKNQTTKWKYDEFGRVTNKTDQAGTEILRYKYDPDSRLTNRWSVAKGGTGYGYDGVGNLLVINYPTDPDVNFSYDELNRPVNMVDAVGTTAYAYASGGQLWKEDGPFADDTVTNVYNNRLRTGLYLKQPTGAWTNGFGYDAAKRLTNVTSQAGVFSYFLGGSGAASPLPAMISLPNTSYITNTYGTVARLTGTYLKKNDGTVLDKYEYTYNAGNQRTQATRTDASTVGYTYDPIGQLTNADSSVSGEDRGYVYDHASNLTNRLVNGVGSSFSVDNKNQLTAVVSGSLTPTYDGNGNLIDLTDYTLDDNQYVYDEENRLITWAKFNWDTFEWEHWTDFEYDGFGRLRKRTEWANEDGGLVFSQRFYYIYDGMRVIQERNWTNNPYVSYTRGTDLSGGLQGAGGIGGLLARSHGYANTNGQWYVHNYYHADGNGNITYLETSAQGLAASYRYDPYGNEVASSGSLAFENTYRFSSKEYHFYSGMYYYGFRFYSPNLQRWMNRDPIGEIGFQIITQRKAGLLRSGPNLYCFVGNKPINSNDPLGLEDDTGFPLPDDENQPDQSSAGGQSSNPLAFSVDWSCWSWGSFWGWGIAGAAGGGIAGSAAPGVGTLLGIGGGFVAGAGGYSLDYIFNHISWDDPNSQPPPGQFERNYRTLPAKYQ